MYNNGTGCINIVVKDDDGCPVPYSYVYLSDSKDSSQSYKTDSEGRLTLAAAVGEYKAAAYHSGYIPRDIDVRVVKNNVKDYEIYISKGDLIVGGLKIHRMNLAEIVDAGVDISNPENLNTVRFAVTVRFTSCIQEEEIIYTGGNDGDVPDISIAVNGNGGGIGDTGGSPGGGGGGNDKPSVSATPVQLVGESNVPIYAIIRTQESISWLKDMYMVELGVFNAADSEYVIEDSRAYINIPDGLSLVATDESRSVIAMMGDIPGNENKYASWVLRGDRAGKYNVSADFSGTLTPFNCPVKAHFATEQNINIANYENVVIKIMPEMDMYPREKYYIQFSVHNGSEFPLYNFSTSFNDYTVPGVSAETYVINPETGERELYDSYQGETHTYKNASKATQTPVISGNATMEIDTLYPGETVYGTYCVEGMEGSSSSRLYLKYVDTIVQYLEGENLGVTIDISPIPGHVLKSFYQVVQRPTYFGDPVDVTSGAYVDNYEALSVTGDAVLSLDLSYNSRMSSEDGTLGAGWYHNFETYIKEEYGMIHYYTSPYTRASFINEESLNGNVYGTIENGELVLSDEVYGDTITYKSITTGMEDYVLIKNADGTYTMNTPGGYIFEYNADGKLTRMVLEDGSAVSLTHTDNQTIITEEGSGNRLKLDYISGRLISVTDNDGRQTTFAYTDNLLTQITNPIGERITYEYDESGRLIKASNNVAPLSA